MTLFSKMPDMPFDLSDEQQLGVGVAIGAITTSYLVYRLFIRQHHWNLPGPRQSLVTGDLMDFRSHKYQLHLLLDEYVKKHGDLFTFSHQGHQLVVASDRNLVDKILIKEFHSFENRKFFIDMPWPCHQMITMATPPKAKLLRQLVKAVVGAESVKNCWSHYEEAVASTIQFLEAKAEKGIEVNSSSLAQGYIMQVLLKVAFSLDYPNQSDNNTLFVNLCDNFVKCPGWINELAAIPLFRRLIKYLPSGFKKHLAPFVSTAVDIVTARRNDTSNKYNDILDVLLKAQQGNDAILDEDLIAQAIVLLTAVETATSATLAIATYYIAKHADVQQRLQEEIDALSSEEGFPTYEHLQHELKYLDQVLDEVLRLHPSGFMLMRECTKDITIDNISFRKGDGVLIPTYSIQRDPENYEKPNTFNPDRTDRKSRFLTFGEGMRMCPGKLMASSEMKMYLVNMLKNFDLKLSDESQQLDVKTYVTVQAMMVVDEPIRIRVEKRRSRPATP